MENELANMIEETDKMREESPPGCVPESDTRPLLAAEQYPQPHGPSPVGTIHDAHHTVVVTRQPTTTPAYRPDAPDWVGTDALVYISTFNMLCCCVIAGIPALAFSLMAREKKELGQIREAKGYSVAAILCNVFSALLGVGATVGVTMYTINTLKQNDYNSYNG